MMRYWMPSLLVSAMLSVSAGAMPVISFGDEGTIVLLPDLAEQKVEFHITGETMIDGLELNLQIGDGGIELGGTDVGPIITGIDFVTGTIFEGRSPKPQPVVDYPRAVQHTVDIASKVAASGLLVTVTFNTEGVWGGDMQLLLKGVAGAFDTTLFDGQDPVAVGIPQTTMIQVVPEPTTAALVMALGCLAVVKRRPFERK
jgi:hypothetical protein